MKNRLRSSPTERREKMGLYKQGKIYHMQKTLDGVRFKRSTGTRNKKLAEKIYSQWHLELEEGKFFDPEEGSKRTFTELAQKYELREVKKLKGWKSSQSYFNQLKKFFGSYLVSKIDTPLIDVFKEFRESEGVKPATINRQLNILKRMLNLAKKRWQWIKDVPHVEMEPKADNKRVRYLSFEEYHKVLSACDEWIREIVMVAAWTGLRLSNLINLKGGQVNLFNRTITIDEDNTKNGEPLVIPISEAVFEILKTRMKQNGLSDQFIFMRHNRPLYKLEVQRGFKKALVQAEITNFRWHDLRHCFASWHRQAKTDIHTLADLMGHKDTRMTMRYAHIGQENLTNAVKILETYYLSTKSVLVEKKGVS
jgi:integrase